MWWNWKGIVHYELLPPDQIIDSNSTVNNWKNYAKQSRESDLINRKGVVFHHENARPYTSLVTRQKLRELDWEVLMHPSYILAPEYHLFQSLQNSLMVLTLKETFENLSQFFVQKS